MAAMVIAMMVGEQRQEMVHAMTPLSFDPTTAREVTGDAEARAIEAKARADADEQTFCPPATNGGETYWGQVQAAMRLIVYREQYTKRMSRNERKKTPNVELSRKDDYELYRALEERLSDVDERNPQR
jgi:hypothetical protein